jgi:hypothetical protein
MVITMLTPFDHYYWNTFKNILTSFIFLHYNFVI